MWMWEKQFSVSSNGHEIGYFMKNKDSFETRQYISGETNGQGNFSMSTQHKRESTDQVYRCYDANYDEVFIVKSERPFWDNALANSQNVKFFINKGMIFGTLDEAESRIGTIVFKSGSHTIELTESIEIWQHKVLVVMVTSLISMDVYAALSL